MSSRKLVALVACQFKRLAISEHSLARVPDFGVNQPIAGLGRIQYLTLAMAGTLREELPCCVTESV
jgi:hypothetical protein